MSGLKFMGQNKITKLAKPISTITDNNGNDVLRIVDSAPFAYDEDNNALNVNVINNLGNNEEQNILWQNEVARKIIYTRGLSWYYPLVDLYDDKLADYGKKGIPEAINFGGKLNVGPSNELSPVLDLGENSHAKFVMLPNDAKLKGLSKFTLMGFFHYASSGGTYQFYNDYVGVGTDGNYKARFSFRIVNGKTVAILRFGDVNSTNYTLQNDSVLTAGFHHFAVTVDIGTKKVLFYRNGTPLQQTVTTGEWTETILSTVEDDTNPILGGFYGQGGGFIGACESMAHIARFGRVLTDAEILAIAQAGGLGI